MRLMDLGNKICTWISSISAWLFHGTNDRIITDEHGRIWGMPREHEETPCVDATTSAEDKATGLKDP